MIQRCLIGRLPMNRCRLHRRTRYGLAIGLIDLEFAGYLMGGAAKLSDALPQPPCNFREPLRPKNEECYQKNQ